MDDDKGVGISEAKKEQNSKSTKNEAGRKSPGIVISKLDSWSVHRICSGQVVISLAVAVKELVENALDAGAKEVIVRTREFGSKSIEVQDNGEGILPENYDSLCLKHFTSKLRKFSDLESIATFGFRGEALSSLCALGQVSVVTKHTSKEVGASLRYNNEGVLEESKPCARETGSTICVENIFSSLPVRHKQFMTALKKEFTKMVHFISGYALIARGVSLSVVNFDDKGRRNEVLKKRAHITYKDNIVDVFGYKEASKLVEYEPVSLPLDVKILEEFRLTKVGIEYFEEVCIEGFISSCMHGKGRSTADRQFFFVNSRPCDHAKLTKLVNQVYHQYNITQQPFIMLNVLTPQALVDVNLTPDKRTLLLHRENVMLAMIKASLAAMFDKQATQYSVNSIEGIPSQISMLRSSFVDNTPDSSFKSLNTSIQDNSIITGLIDGDEDISDVRTDGKGNHQVEVKDFRSRFVSSGFEKRDSLGTRDTSTGIVGNIRDAACASSSAKINIKGRFEFVNLSSKRKSQDAQFSAASGRPKRSTGESGCRPLSSFGFTRSLGKEQEADPNFILEERARRLDAFLKGVQQNCKVQYIKSTERDQVDLSKNDQAPFIAGNVMDTDANSTSDSDIDSTEKRPVTSRQSRHVDESRNSASHRNIIEMRIGSHTEVNSSISDSEPILNDSPPEKQAPVRIDNSLSDNKPAMADPTISNEDGHANDFNGNDNTFVDDVSKRRVGICKLSWTIDELRQDFQAAIRQEDLREAPTQTVKGDCRFRARINPKENNSAESELIREISKDMFKKMEIIGQFNKGFIVVRLRNDLFIVDQHAADEKFNFETLQATTSIDCQPLAVPQKLSLAPGNEQTVIEHIAIFEKNGFRITIDEEAPWGHRLALNAVPQSGQWQMGMAEVDELIFMLNDNSHPNLINCRPAKVRSMFAMKACRRSVMVGDELSRRDMKRVVGQLSELQHPWNCPHGRPTMRHLVNLSFVNVY
ncbi:mismatch repair endonuclease PMS2-like [Varroa jacobsoni]|uniref:mismatch repair endonuclease PMS2-like n=1 Tax=Varroa jacobsoni TaxID=62625 RepID=UPI000BF53E80|nr:mismatch repair endonuclease PMS2-like [Varroa jacobsoni]XP_022689402.1 mismatch repair endonuclease PMS2-like [Varroa jacobsoni]XP_022689403.1 mismatch repair endonuclease PMS2-like [Varroa jacobsoni]XP_022689404.1 mismatch repair endonuclease PMS2-like [Varroa jacobsoni]